MTKIKSVNIGQSNLEKHSDHKLVARQFLEMVTTGNIDEAYVKMENIYLEDK
jgi:hypothetical protein